MSVCPDSEFNIVPTFSINVLIMLFLYASVVGLFWEDRQTMDHD